MILACYGIAGLGPAELSDMLVRCGLSHGIWVDGKFVQRKINNWVQPIPVIFTGTRVFMRKYTQLKKRDFLAFVVDSPAEISNLKGCVPLGYQKVSRNLVRFTRLDCDEIIDVWDMPYLKGPDEIPIFTYEVAPVLQSIVGMFKDSSVLPAIQTLMYKIKNPDARAKASSLVRRYLGSNMPYADFQRKMRKTVDPQVYKRYCEILESPKFKHLRSAVILGKANPNSYKRIAAKFKVSDFDVKYLMKTTL